MSDFNKLLYKINIFYKMAFIKLSYIRKLSNGKYRVYSKNGKNLGTYDSKSAAEKRLKDIEFFKHLNKKASLKLDLTKIDEISYSAIMRFLVNNYNNNIVSLFQKEFKKFFDQEYLNGKENPQNKSLIKTLLKINKNYPITLPKKLLKDNDKWFIDSIK